MIIENYCYVAKDTACSLGKDDELLDLLSLKKLILFIDWSILFNLFIYLQAFEFNDASNTVSDIFLTFLVELHGCCCANRSKDEPISYEFLHK